MKEFVLGLMLAGIPAPSVNSYVADESNPVAITMTTSKGGTAVFGCYPLLPTEEAK